MVNLLKMGRKPLGRVAINLTLPEQMKADAEQVAKHQQRAVSSIVEELLRPYLAKIKATMKRSK